MTDNGRHIGTVGVIGVGTMGAGLAEVLARSGLNVIAVEVDQPSLARAHAFLEESTRNAVTKGKLTEPARDALLSRITGTLDLSRVAAADLVIEAVPENIDLKRALFAELDGIVRPEAILATSSSALSVTDLAMSTAAPHRVMGMHFFNPVPVQELVEVVGTVVTPPALISDITTLACRLGKHPIVVGDTAGFIANALLMGYLNHAVTMYENKYATREDIDAAMQLGCGYPLGPLALADLVGLDTCRAVLEEMYAQGGDRRHAPAPLWAQMISAGRLGRKSGHGFYRYDRPGFGVVVPEDIAPSPSLDTTGHTRPIHRVAVIGSGIMAVGIAEIFARAGHATTLVARTPDTADRALSRLTASLDRALAKGKITPAHHADTLSHCTTTIDLTELHQVDLVVEAVAEDLHVKTDIFRRLDAICRPGAILATTTSSLPVVTLAAATSRPGDVIGMHFFNPATVMRLVEVVSAVTTAPEVQDTVTDLARRLGKHPVHCADRAGFIVNALLFPYLNDAVKMLAAHYASIDDIDQAMTSGCHLPMGPFALMDVVGLDVSLAIQRELHREYRDPGLRPAPLLEHMVKGGYLGRKTGHGFRSTPC
ncbi:Fatty acid oxidation complex subunit alpha [Austwickia sp. TVS 96-490-7B]|uniref:3-hydroxyacyl-CoA dehydrogenase family protein n=1 Tax=Austwickia sp. TVS 96-490-7B TaxID=2830843 RepID=UPI001C586D9E|nr:3-hydroxybutyryl-CoA dehydrogenase [Austwickia sp. TVS 96-490-7B]MBW3084561.1 Fatty acid oxidation complex subunit alpha [Austwickia sp. TVS 96-490-7B]